MKDITIQQLINYVDGVVEKIKKYDEWISRLMIYFNLHDEMFFRRLNEFFVQTENNYQFLKESKHYNKLVSDINYIFDLWFKEEFNSEIYDKLSQMHDYNSQFLFIMSDVSSELSNIENKIKKL